MSKKHFRRLSSSLTALLLASLAIPSASLAENNLGTVNFKTTCNQPANDAFNKGLTLLHHMMYRQADAVFSDAAKTNTDCAMLHWGTAMSNFHPLWPGLLKPEALDAGRAALEHIAAANSGSDIEQAFAKAVAAFYAGNEISYGERKKAWANAQIDMHTAFPQDVEATAFGALALLTAAPRGDANFTNQRKAGALMENLNKTTDLHPGVFHYAIHAYDNPALYKMGLPFAETYGEITPDVPHALHMPSHIFVRAGDWDQVVDWNIRSAKTGFAQPVGDLVSSHYAHAMDYLIYAHLQRGEFSEAEKLTSEFIDQEKYQVNFGSAYGLAASSVRAALEQEKWQELAGLDEEIHASIPWEKFPQAVAMRWFAIGLGAARSGDVNRAQFALSKLSAIREKLVQAKLGYWKNLTDAQMLSVQAWIALDQGNTQQAISLHTEAADIEDAAGKAPVTPGHVLPARELLGDLHKAAGNDEAAVAAYEAALKGAPNRRRSITALK
jgi:tetratricopeptide (TPR) repeat protein